MMNLSRFLTELSVSPIRMAEFLSNPSEYMKSMGVDAEGRRALKSGSPKAVWGCIHGTTSGSTSEVDEVAEDSKYASLVVVGTGIRSTGQLTIEAIASIISAEIVHYVAVDPIAESVIKSLNPSGAASLTDLYCDGARRVQIYEAMVDRILQSVRIGRKTCAAFYGHPGVFGYAAHEAVRRAALEGYEARMLPAVSAEDCLFADLGIDPAKYGCQTFEATDFLLHDRKVDTSSHLVLFQVGVIGDEANKSERYNVDSLFALMKTRLCALYGPRHIAVVYEAPVVWGLTFWVNRVELGRIEAFDISTRQILYVPPGRKSTINSDVHSLIQAGIPEAESENNATYQ